MPDQSANIFPAKPGDSPGFPENPLPLVFEEFKGLNTKPTRNDIDDNEMYICDGFFPIGKSNLRILPDIGPSLYTVPTGKTIISYYFANISTTPVAIVLLSDGSIVQVNTTNGDTTAVAPSGTITNPANGIGLTQASGNQFIIIVAPQTNGFWIWNGTLLFDAGTLSPEITVVNGGSGYTSATVTVSGGSGTGTAFSTTLQNGVIISVDVTNPGSGYVIGDTPTLTVTGTGSGASLTAVIMPFGIQGTNIETFVGRSWVENGPNILFTAPESVVDFSASDGGGIITSQDSFLRYSYIGIKQSNGFLYLLGDSSMNAISGVTTNVVDSVPLTTFTNQNVDPQIGTAWKDSVQVFSRNIVFANSFGIHVSYGGAVTKISSPLDGIYATVPDIGNFQPSSAIASVFGLQIYMLLYPVVDQWTGIRLNKLLIWDSQKWFTSQQGVDLKYIASQEINSILTAWGTDGASIFPLFQSPSNAFLKVAQSKLWKDPAYYYTKQAIRLFGLIFYTVQGGTTTVYIDNENSTENGSGSYPFSVASAQSQIMWQNNLGQLVTWNNNAGEPVFWVTAGFSVFRGQVSQNGILLGMTLTTNDGDDTLTSLTAVAQVVSTNL